MGINGSWACGVFFFESKTIGISLPKRKESTTKPKRKAQHKAN